MNFSDACAYCLHKVYNQLAIHDAPLFVLDLFLPILTTETWKEALQNEIKDAKVFNSLEELFDDLHNTGTVLTSEKHSYTFNNTSSNAFSFITFNFDCTSNNGTWLYGSTDES